MCEKAHREYWKCNQCFLVVAVDHRASRLVCGACDGRMGLMGVVSPPKQRLEKEKIKCVCDARCTFAKGPVCECECGGLHHGSEMLVEVKVDAGGIPKATAKDPKEVENALANLAAYRAELDAIATAIADLETAHCGAYLVKKWHLQQAVYHARYLKSHAGRMKTLNEARKLVANLA